LPAYFLDSSALAKLYHQEIGTAVVEQILQDASHTIWIPG
jgi:hypothetical protein